MLSRFDLRTRLTLGFGALVLIVIVLGGYGASLLSRLGPSIDHVMRENYRSVIAMQHLRETPRSLRELNPMVTRELEAVVMAAMSKSMHDRPSASELSYRFGAAVGRRATDARRVPGTAPVFAPPPPPLPPPLPPLPVPERDASTEPTHIIDASELGSDAGLTEEDRNPMRRLLDKIFDSES